MNVRRGFSVGEIVVALAVMSIAGVIVSETATWAVQERAALDQRDRAITLAKNLLEAAKTHKAGELKSWAEGEKLPADVLARWPASALKIAVEDDRGLNKVTVTVVLLREPSAMARPATLIAWIAPAKASAP